MILEKESLTTTNLTELRSVRTGGFAAIRKRDGRLAEFHESKITDAIFKAAQSVGGEDRTLAMELTLEVLRQTSGKNLMITYFLLKTFRTGWKRF